MHPLDEIASRVSIYIVIMICTMRKSEGNAFLLGKKGSSAYLAGDVVFLTGFEVEVVIDGVPDRLDAFKRV